MALHEALIALQTGCSGLLTLKEEDPHFKKVFTYQLVYESMNDSIQSQL